MQPFRNLSIAASILLAFLLVIVLAAAVAALDIWALREVNVRLTDVVETKAEALKLAARLNRRVTESRVVGKNLLLVEDGAQIDEELARLQLIKDAIAEDLKALNALRMDSASRQLVDDFQVLYAAYLVDLARIAALVDAGDRGQAVALSFGSGRVQWRKIQQLLSSLVSDKEQDILAARVAAERAFGIALTLTLGLLAFMVLASAAVAFSLSRMLSRNLNRLLGVTEAIASGDLDRPLERVETAELQRLGDSVRTMQTALRAVRDGNRDSDWLKTSLARLSERLSGDPELQPLAAAAVSELATTLGAAVGALYVAARGDTRTLSLMGSYAYTERKHLANRFAPGEGLIGQCALERSQILLTNVPDDYVKVTSGLGEAVPRALCVTPLLREGRVEGVVELGTMTLPEPVQLEYIQQAMPVLAVAVESAQDRTVLAQALAASQQLTEELQAQQEQLRVANEELTEQAQMLKASEERLQLQQEELEASNAELEEKNEALQRQKRSIAGANQNLAQQRAELEDRARELALASKYKSEFLANMSHELRTPLNSLMLLSAGLADNSTGNLTDDQVESARIIQRSGNDLLALINEILDLARIEAGRTDLHSEPVALAEVASSLQDAFGHLAADKGVTLMVQVEPGAPEHIDTDRKRLEQVVRNFVSNALKFTEQGSVSVSFACPAAGTNLSRSGLDPSAAVAIAVADTGIGIPADKQAVIFEAFQQADGGTARRYGGTGLGLSIARNLAGLLGGEIQLQSTPGQGSRFTLYLPVALPAAEAGQAEQPAPGPRTGSVGTGERQAARPQTPNKPVQPAPIADDREALAEGDTIVLVIEDDTRFAKLLLEQCHQRGFKALSAVTGEEGLRLAATLRPQAIILDIRLPGMDGWAVLERLKDNPDTRHIPVHVMSVDDGSMDALQRGAIGFMQKPVDRAGLESAFKRLEDVFSRKVKDLLVVEDDDTLRREVVNLIASDDVQVAEASSGAAALDLLRDRRFDCMVLDLGLPDMTGFELLRQLAADPAVAVPPVVVYTGQEVTHAEELELRNYSDSIIVKGAKSRERLLDETSLFLHRMVSTLPERARRMIADLHDADRLFQGRRVLLVDDDLRNVFALSKLLEAKGLEVLKAEDGAQALKTLAEETPVDLVLMDIMMPVMDGYETMRRIRARPELQKLPIIALTAKAMKEDFQRCIEAGADDYLTKPVDLERLFSMMRIWLYR